MIAVDMDGTFLSSKKDYNRPRFAKIYQEIVKQKIKFVVASGNQYYQLRSFFPDIAAEIAFAAENGAYVIDQNTVQFIGQIDAKQVQQTIQLLQEIETVNVVVCGEKSAYVLRTEPPAFYQECLHYYHRLQSVDDYNQIDDTIIKFALNFPVDQVPKALKELTEALNGGLIPVSSGHGAVDLISPGIHKAYGLQLLAKRWGIAQSEIAAFGDSSNDLEMLEYAGYSYAMKNAVPVILKAASYVTEFDNNQQGVLDELEKLLGMAE